MKYTCKQINSGICFESDRVKCCQTNALGPTFYKASGLKKINIDEITSIRNEIIDKFEQGIVPDCCKNCYQLEEKDDSFFNTKEITKIRELHVSHWKHCNSSCIYCVYQSQTKGAHSDKVQKSLSYDIIPMIDYLLEKEMIDPIAFILFSGGEPTVLDGFEEIIRKLEPIIDTQMHIYTSGIKYSPAVSKLLSVNKCELLISLDCGSEKTYKILKRVNRFNKVVKNIKKYIKNSEKPNTPVWKKPFTTPQNSFAKERIVLKYILIKNVNDSKTEIDKFFKVVKKLGLKRVSLDVDRRQDIETKIPSHYHDLYEFFKEKAHIIGVKIDINAQNEKILARGEVF